MEKTEKIAIAELNKKLDETQFVPQTVRVRVGDDSVDVDIKRYLSLAEYMQMVQDAVDFHFAADSGEYHTALHEFALNAALLIHLTDLDVDADIEEINRFVAGSDVMEQIDTCKGDDWMFQFARDVEVQVEYLKQMALSQERRKLNEITAAFDQIQHSMEKVGKTFEDIDPAMMTSVLSRLSGMDEYQLGKAVVEARDADFVEQRAQLHLLNDGEH